MMYNVVEVVTWITKVKSFWFVLFVGTSMSCMTHFGYVHDRTGSNWLNTIDQLPIQSKRVKDGRAFNGFEEHINILEAS